MLSSEISTSKRSVDLSEDRKELQYVSLLKKHVLRNLHDELHTMHPFSHLSRIVRVRSERLSSLHSPRIHPE